MSDPKNKWTRPGAPPAPMFFGEKERNLVKQVNDELTERVLGQTIAYYPISLEDSNFNDIYGEAKEKVTLPPVRVFAYVEVTNDQTNTKDGYEYQTKLTVNFHRRRLVEDQNLYVRVGDFVQYGDVFYEIVKTFNDTRYYFGQVEHKFQISAECVRARSGAFRVLPEIDRPTLQQKEETDISSPAPRPAPYPPLAATYITVNAETKLFGATGPIGSLQFQQGGGSFTGSANLTFLSSSGRLGINTDSPTNSLTIIGDFSASSNAYFGNDVYIAGTLYGGSPLKIAGSIQIRDPLDTASVVASFGDVSGDGSTTISASCGLFADVTASAYVSASLYYGDGRYLTNVTASAITTGDGPIGSLQFRVDNPIANEISGTANVLYDLTNNSFKVDAGLSHNRVSVSSSYTASAGNYILGISSVPSDISPGQVLIVKDESGLASSTNTITLNPSGSQTIDGAPAIYVESPYGSVLLYTDGSDWYIY